MRPGSGERVPQRGQTRHPASIGCRHCGHAGRTAAPQLEQNAWPFRAGVAQAGHGTGTGSRRMKYRMIPIAFGMKIASSVHSTWFIPRRFASANT